MSKETKLIETSDLKKDKNGCLILDPKELDTFDGDFEIDTNGLDLVVTSELHVNGSLKIVTEGATTTFKANVRIEGDLINTGTEQASKDLFVAGNHKVDCCQFTLGNLTVCGNQEIGESSEVGGELIVYGKRRIDEDFNHTHWLGVN